MPMGDEVDIRDLLLQLLEQGYPLYLPCFDGEKLVFRRAEDLENMKPGRLKTLEPSQDAAELDPAEASHVLVPGRAFDRSGNRLGRGNGGYDHWIADQRKVNQETVFWGVCYECQVVNAVPVEAHDEAVDEVITARGSLRASPS